MLSVTVQPGAVTTALVYRAGRNAIGAVLLLAHGAGAGQRSPWMIAFARALADRGLDIVTFNFLYTEHGRRMPDRRPLLDACYGAVIGGIRETAIANGRPLFTGGKSMGGRIATHVAAEPDAPAMSGIVLLGYPLHPPGRPDQRRDAHLPSVKCPMLFVQGSRDAFGRPAELDPVLETIQPRPMLHVVEGGDHSFQATRDPVRQAALMAHAQDTIVDWIRAA